MQTQTGNQQFVGFLPELCWIKGAGGLLVSEKALQYEDAAGRIEVWGKVSETSENWEDELKGWLVGTSDEGRMFGRMIGFWYGRFLKFVWKMGHYKRRVLRNHPDLKGFREGLCWLCRTYQSRLGEHELSRLMLQKRLLKEEQGRRKEYTIPNEDLGVALCLIMT